MTPSDHSSERRERMKQILTDSYPRVGKEDREPLPGSILSELQGGEARASESKTEPRSLWQRLLVLLRGPQALGLAAASVLVVVGIIALLPDRAPPAGTGPDKMRSPDPTTPDAPLVVLYRLSAEQVESLRSSPLFDPAQLVEVPAGQDLATLLEEKLRPHLILIDGSTGTVTVPFDPDNLAPIGFDANTDLETTVLDLQSELAAKALE